MNVNKIFKEQKVWLSNASNLNDPFECSIQEIAKELIDEQVKKEKQQQLIGFIMTANWGLKDKKVFYNMTPIQIQSILNNIKYKSKFKDKYNIFRETFKMKTGGYPSNPRLKYKYLDTQLNEVGIFSLTENPINQLMWAHYGEESKGIAIGFEVEYGNKLSNTKQCLKVHYADELPKFEVDSMINSLIVGCDELGRYCSYQKISFDDPNIKASISTKPICWEYEEEWRYVEEKYGQYSLPGKIVEIIFGLRCTIENRKKYKELVSKYIPNEVKFFEIQKIPNSNIIKKIEIDPKIY